ncbi:hypothetical protein CYMTET_31065 [Cymbomonas tetramitiformis]|uniref:D-alanine--D-alanine ligase n=1 Tax=Cymbomonas tetramitiformis TaxID=36881 RepID=A0AAE0FHW6_9CHLO|nr:hypothetical protein CYMTET_31065 [Cymbomonas tetramitiformis]
MPGLAGRERSCESGTFAVHGLRRPSISGYCGHYSARAECLQVCYHTPPRFPTDVTASIRAQATTLFEALGLSDFVRMDGWVLPAGDGAAPQVVFSDINIISGMEQTSFLFQQAAQVGLTHKGVLRRILESACRRHGIALPWRRAALGDPRAAASSSRPPASRKRRVRVLFGGDTSERQVSLMSGTNVWLKLMLGDHLDIVPEPYLLAPADPGTEVTALPVWKLPYEALLRHTVEEVVEGCNRVLSPEMAQSTATMREEAALALGRASQSDGEEWTELHPPQLSNLEAFVRESSEAGDVVFVAVHGGVGEDGRLQALLESREVRFTGCGAEASRLCMDKMATGRALAGMEAQGIFSLRKLQLPTSELIGASQGTPMAASPTSTTAAKRHRAPSGTRTSNAPRRTECCWLL